MSRLRWHLARRVRVYDPHGTVGLYSAFGGMRGAYAADYVDHTRPEPGADQPDRDRAAGADGPVADQPFTRRPR